MERAISLPFSQEIFLLPSSYLNPQRILMYAFLRTKRPSRVFSASDSTLQDPQAGRQARNRTCFQKSQYHRNGFQAVYKNFQRSQGLRIEQGLIFHTVKLE
jgi:hypothetical protein